MKRFLAVTTIFFAAHELKAEPCWNLADALLSRPRSTYKALVESIEPKLSHLSPHAQRAFELYNQSLRSRMVDLIPEKLVLYVIADEEKLVYSQQLASLFEQVLASSPSSQSKVSKSNLAKLMRSQLKGQVPLSTITDRVEEFFARPSLERLQRVLGKMDIDEVGLLVHGGDPLKPTKGSLIGQYLEESGASSVVRDFPTRPTLASETRRGGEPDMNSPHGPQRLVVAVSERSLAIYKRLFSRHNFLVHVHTPHQGTLVVAQNGRAGTYARLSNEMRLNDVGTLMPHILLNSDEGQRATQYFMLGEMNHQSAREPWALKGYCATGGYDSCTHWIGNLPVGDPSVAEYAFPGAIDEHASNSLFKGERDKAPRIQRLRKYNLDETDFAELVHRVWAVPGHQQLANVLGLRRQNLNGELANPGYVALSLLGRVDQERIPVVFYVVRNHRQEISPNFELQISAY